MDFQGDEQRDTVSRPALRAAGDSYSIRAMASPVVEEGFLARIIWPEGRVHSYLQLTTESAEGLTRAIAELHFTSKDAEGTSVDSGKKLMNMLAIVSGRLGLEKPFIKLTEKMGLSTKMANLKAVQTSAREPKEGTKELACITGGPDSILRLWNRACQASLIINHAELPFMPLGTAIHGPINCHAGTRTVMHFMGEEFRKASEDCQQFDGDDLSSAIPFLNVLMLDMEKMRAVDFDSLETERHVLGQRLYETGCMLRGQIKKENPRMSGKFIP